MKDKLGFTLIELLAVIIILAIIALIATPIISNVINDARISAGRSETQMIYGGINNYCATIEMKKQIGTLDSEDIDCTEKSSFTTEEISKMVNLGNAKVISNTYSNGKLTNLVIESNNHTFTLCKNGKFAIDDEECDGEVALVGSPIEEKAKELVYENNACKTDGTTYQYMGGCYIKGNPNNNYIWYSGFLWRIMGVNADGTIRMITDENVTAIPWGAEDTAENWDGSYAKDWLNNYFYPRLKGNNIIKEETWCSETTTSSSSARTTCTNNLSTEKSKVGLITIDEYNLAGGSSSYLNIKQVQWTMTPYNSSNAWYVRNLGSADDGVVPNTDGLRAVINVNPDVTITSGNGTLETNWSSQAGPYILNEDKNVEIIGKLNEKATSGEYVIFAGKKYRVVDKDSNGNTKLILDGYYEETAGTIYTMSYGSNSTFSKDIGIGQKLNGDVLNWLTNNDESEKSKLVRDYTWYQNEFSGGNYKISLNEESPTRSIQATVGLIRVGEMLSGQSSSILTNEYNDISSFGNGTTYWTMTPYTSSSSVWGVLDNGLAIDNVVPIPYGLRAVIVANYNVTITSGNGTWANPYQI